ncbi:MAG: hypothetical protein ACRED1_06815, partial [Limisphaerales bacterium]
MMAFSISAAWGQTPPAPADSSITNLRQLVEVLADHERVVRDVRLEATVCAASDPSIGVAVLKDGTDVEMVELGSQKLKILPGEKIRIDHKECLLRRRDSEAQIAAAPVIDNDFVHDKVTATGGVYLTAGGHPFTLEWFNQSEPPCLDVNAWRLNSSPMAPGGSMLSSGVSNDAFQAGYFKAGLQAECFEGSWWRVPDFDLLAPVKTGVVTNFDLSFCPQDQMAGLRLRGTMEAPANGYYIFSVRSASGSLLFVGDTGIQATVIGTGRVPRPLTAAIDEPLANDCNRQWMSVEGRVASAVRVGRGLELDLRAGRNSLLARVADADGEVSGEFLNSIVRVTGVGCGVFSMNGKLVLGQLSVAGADNVKVLRVSAALPPNSASLLKIRYVQALPIPEAAREVPVHIRGVVTSVTRRYDNYLTIQDNTRGIFVNLQNATNSLATCGDYDDVIGHSGAGDFAPIVRADKVVRLGRGQMPEPAHPAWNELVNGSMDVQWVEF